MRRQNLISLQVINHVVFKHTGISWEWGIVFVEATLFFLGVESWKWGKRVFFRRRAQKMGQTADDLERRAFGSFVESEKANMSLETTEGSSATS